MKILVIQTVRPVIEILVYDRVSKKVIAENHWKSERNEIDLLVKEIEKLMAKAELSFSDLDGVLVFVGMGAFSATRIGVTVANVIANFSKIKLWETETDTENNEEILKLIQEEENWREVKIATPKYRSEPKITPSKKKNLSS